MPLILSRRTMCPSSAGIEESRKPLNDADHFARNRSGRIPIPKFHEEVTHNVEKSVDIRKPVDHGTEFSAKCLEMSPILPFLPLNPLQPGPKGGEGTEGLKKRFPSSSPKMPFVIGVMGIDGKKEIASVVP